MGRCGKGCIAGGIPNRDLDIYTQDCFEHDQCVAYFNELDPFGINSAQPSCNWMFLKAIDDFIYGQLCPNISTIDIGISANSSYMPLQISTGNPLQLKLSLHPSEYNNWPADWWIVANHWKNWFSLSLDASLSWKPGLIPVLSETPLCDVNESVIKLEQWGLSLDAGTWTFFFGVDLDSNGQLTSEEVGNALALDWVQVDVMGLPDTGQTQSYTDIYGEDADHTLNPPSYTKLDSLGNPLADSATSWAMVRDNITGLVWEVKTNDGSIHDGNSEYTFAEAKSLFIAQVNGSHFGSYSDWRLPTVHELSQIHDLGRFNPAININYFPNMTNTVSYSLDPWASWYWSSNEDHLFGSWSVDFVYGWISLRIPPIGQVLLSHVIAVSGKSLQWGEQFSDNGDGTVSDLLTGLMWESSMHFNSDGLWESGISYCENLFLGGNDDWRLPNRKELLTLVTYRPGGSINIAPQFCPVPLDNGVCNYYEHLCSSTTYAATDEYGHDPDNSAWGVSIGSASMGMDPEGKQGCYSILCVRGVGD